MSRQVLYPSKGINVATVTSSTVVRWDPMLIERRVSEQLVVNLPSAVVSADLEGTTRLHASHVADHEHRVLIYSILETSYFLQT